jgi:ribosomal protein S18 acetylase RimI-like enzyme
MQALQQALWARNGPDVQAHVGDLAWWLHREAKQQLWLDGDRCVAWARLTRPATLDYDVDSPGLHRHVLAWFESQAEGDTLTTYAHESNPEWLEALSTAGYERPDPYGWYAYQVRELDGELPTPAVPEGFTLRTVDGEEDFRKRVEVHRAVWAPSRVTEDVYRRVTQAWPYRADLDCVLEAPDGTFASYVLCWYDDANQVGEFEPMGTHPDYRRQGLGAAICRYGLQRLQAVGARQAVVYAGGGDENAGARALYESVGFRRHARVVELRKQRA